MSKHVHYDLIKQWAENPNEYDVFRWFASRPSWVKTDNPHWLQANKYKLVKKPIVVKYRRWLHKTISGKYSIVTHSEGEPFPEKYSPFVKWIDEDWQEYVVT